MRIENTVEVDAPLDRVWALVNDIPRVAPCMPGAALTGVGDDDTYEGTVAVKLGPLRMSYKGKVVVEAVDEANHSARLAASGRDTKGAGTARAAVETRLEPVDDTRTRLHVTSDVQLTGKVASFGRGGAINDVAARLFGQFADCLRATLEAPPADAAADVGTAVPGGGGTAVPADGGTATAAEATAPAAAGTVAPGPGTTAAPAGGGGTAAEAMPSGTTESAGTTAQEPPSPGTTAQGTPSPGTADAGPASGTGAAGDGTTTAGAGATPASGAAAAPSAAVPAGSPRAPAPQPVEALDAGSLVGTVIKGRLRAMVQAIAGFFRRLFGRGSTS
jgi:carbon monoxide dehydrogenase subunit G